VWEILRASGIDPAPRRTGPTWAQFLCSQAEAMLACDFFTVDLLDGTQAYVLAVIEHATRRISILGLTLHPTGEWAAQQARNLIMDLGDQAGRLKFMILGRRLELHHRVRCRPRRRRDPDRALQHPDTPDECDHRTLDRGLPARTPGPHPRLEPTHLRQVLHQYETHHNQHRPHRSLHSAAPLKPLPKPADLDLYRVRKQAQVGGMINEYRLVA
jgi:putative transposase